MKRKKYVEVKVPVNPSEKQIAVAAYRALKEYAFDKDWEDSSSDLCWGDWVSYTNPHITNRRKTYDVTKDDIVRNIYDIKRFLELTGLSWRYDSVTSSRCETIWRREDKLVKDWETLWINRYVFEAPIDLMKVIREKNPDKICLEKPDDDYYEEDDGYTTEDVENIKKLFTDAFKKNRIGLDDFIYYKNELDDWKKELELRNKAYMRLV